MTRPLSQLIYARIQEGSGSRRVITLHGFKQYARDVQAYGLAAGLDARVIGLESFKEVYVGRSIVGYTWFVGPMQRPSPLFFGDALAEIERFLWDEIDRQGDGPAELPFLIGVEQGAIMALAAAAAVPDLLSGVIAVRGFLPVVPGWSPPLAPLDRLPVLLAGDGIDGVQADGMLNGEGLAAKLEQWGAVVTQSDSPAGTVPAQTISEWLAAQSARTYHPPASQPAT